MDHANAQADDQARQSRIGRIRVLSRTMAVLCLATSVLLAAGMLFFWLATPAGALLAQFGPGGTSSGTMAWSMRVTGLAISMLPLAALICGLFGARKCFRAFADGRIFSAEAVGGLRTLAISVAVSAILKPLSGAALSVLLSGSAGGGRTLALTFSSDTLLALIFAGTVAVIAWVMGEAITIADENAQFV